MIVRYDPRDLSRIYLLAPDGQYYDLGYRDLRHPPTSLWQHKLARKHLEQEGRSQVDEGAIFRTIDKMREIVDGAVNTTKAARRQRERQLRLTRSARIETEVPPDETASTAGQLPAGRQPHEDMLPVEEWS